MELLKIITRASGGEEYITNAVNYLLDDRAVITEGYGVSSYDAASAATAIEKNIDFWNNQGKNPFLHCIISYTKETAPTAEEAMRLTDEIIKPLTDERMALSCAHDEERTGSSNHTHTLIATTNFVDGSMMHPDNATNYAFAQRVADVTGQPVTLVVENKKKNEWECPNVFMPHTEDDEEEN